LRSQSQPGRSGSGLDQLKDLRSDAASAPFTIQRFEHSLGGLNEITTLGGCFGTGFMLSRFPQKLGSLLGSL